MTSRVCIILTFALFFVGIPCLRAQGLPAAEKTKIEALLSHVGSLRDAEFIRNDKTYDAKTAAKFLRGKWQANQEQIHSAASFIEVAATRSSTTGEPYLIRLKGQTSIPCAEYLSTRLRILEAAKQK